MFRIWSLWADRSEDTGATVQATDPDAALASARACGMAWGLGADPRYLGLYAQAVNESDAPIVTYGSHP